MESEGKLRRAREGLKLAWTEPQRYFTRKWFGVAPYRTIARLLTLALGLFVLKQFFQPMVVVGNSMAPTYWSGEFNVIDRKAYKSNSPQRLDVVAINAGKERLFKRVIGLPGEKVGIINDLLVINGTAYEEPYVKFASGWFVPETNLGPHEFLVIGDNRGMKPQHHTFGIVNRKVILGKALF